MRIQQRPCSIVRGVSSRSGPLSMPWHVLMSVERWGRGYIGEVRESTVMKYRRVWEEWIKWRWIL